MHCISSISLSAQEAPSVLGSRQIGPRQIGPLENLAANWAPANRALFGAQFAIFWQIGPRQIGPLGGKLGPGKSGPGRLGPLAANWAPANRAPADWAPWRQIGPQEILGAANWAPENFGCGKLGPGKLGPGKLGPGKSGQQLRNICKLKFYIGIGYILQTIGEYMSIGGCRVAVYV